MVLMTCGLTGSGESTLAREICARGPSFKRKRLSVDGILFAEHGTYGVDYRVVGGGCCVFRTVLF